MPTSVAFCSRKGDMFVGFRLHLNLQYTYILLIFSGYFSFNIINYCVFYWWFQGVKAERYAHECCLLFWERRSVSRCGSTPLPHTLVSMWVPFIISQYLGTLKIEKKMKIWKIEKLTNLKFHWEKFILSSQDKRKGPRFNVSSERLSPEINILIRSSIPKLTKLDVAQLDCLDSWPSQFVNNHWQESRGSHCSQW